MTIPEAFTHLVGWLDHEIRNLEAEAAKDPVGYALASVTQPERTIIDQFLTKTLASMQSPGQLTEMFRSSGARTGFDAESDLRAFLAEIVRRIGLM